MRIRIRTHTMNSAEPFLQLKYSEHSHAWTDPRYIVLKYHPPPPSPPNSTPVWVQSVRQEFQPLSFSDSQARSLTGEGARGGIREMEIGIRNRNLPTLCPQDAEPWGRGGDTGREWESERQRGREGGRMESKGWYKVKGEYGCCL